MAHRYYSLDEISLQASWLTIGIFDGVHRGHQEIIHRLTAGAHASNLPAVVLTFSQHPAVVLGKRQDFKSLTTPAERAGLLEELGVDTVIFHPFSHDLASQSAEEFMSILKERLGLRHLLVGYDFALGRGREGNASRLAEIGELAGYTVEVVPVLALEDGIISSTRIRMHISTGEVDKAAADLGRFYSICGHVVGGDGRGRKINIPTANLNIPAEKIIPAEGVYACWAWAGGKRYRSVTNIGVRPTFNLSEHAVHIETHILAFDQDIYGQEINLEFATRLRDEMKFPSIESLVVQIRMDIEKAKSILRS